MRVDVGHIWRSASSRGRRILVGAIGSTIAVAVAVAVAMATLSPNPVAGERIRSAVPTAPELEQVNRVTQKPDDWIAAVCEMPLRPLPDYSRLPHATDTSSCRSLNATGSSVSLLIARFPTEFVLQLDLGNEGYAYYAFAYRDGSMFTIATMSRDSVTDGQGFGVSRALEPLERFGFNVYGEPGLP